MNDAIWVAAIVAIPPTIAAVTNLIVVMRVAKKVRQVEHATNSMKDALIAAAFAEGKVLGAAEEKSAAHE